MFKRIAGIALLLASFLTLSAVASELDSQAIVQRFTDEASVTPFPTLQFNRDRSLGLANTMVEYLAFVKDDQGTNPFAPFSYAVMISPELQWLMMQERAALEFWTEDEWDKEWAKFEAVWASHVPVLLELRSKDKGAVTTAGLFSGDISRMVIQTSTGYQFVVDKDLPNAYPDNDPLDDYPFYSSIAISFPQEALVDRPDWIRVYIIVDRSRVMFHWNFED